SEVVGLIGRVRPARAGSPRGPRSRPPASMNSKHVFAIVAVAGLALVALSLLARTKSEVPPPPVAAPTAPNAPAGKAPGAAPTMPAPVPSDPLTEFRKGIQAKDERAVLGAQSMFLAREDDYREPLMKQAKDDAEPRVRSFSVAVLGRMKRPPPESFFI